jgi:hypothetical protein
MPFVFATDTILLAEQLGAELGVPVYHSGSRVRAEEQLITVYDHVQRFVDRRRALIVDEIHSLVTDYYPNYRQNAIDQVRRSWGGTDKYLDQRPVPFSCPASIGWSGRFPRDLHRLLGFSTTRM